jgi:hypothetical protein
MIITREFSVFNGDHIGACEHSGDWHSCRTLRVKMTVGPLMQWLANVALAVLKRVAESAEVGIKKTIAADSGGSTHACGNGDLRPH